MKKSMKLPVFLILVCSMATLFSCQNPMSMETIVHEDGALDKTIVFEKGDSSLVDRNVFGINSQRNWSASVTRLPEDNKENNYRAQYRIVLTKHFNNAADMNAELGTSNDTLFGIKSSFEKKFRWFYTYIRYTETYSPIDRFKMISPSDYFNQEDFQFIERLPGEGKNIAKADSVYLQVLNYKVSDVYGNMAIFKEEYTILTELLKKNNMEQQWFDTLFKKQDYIYDHVVDMRGDPLFAIKMIDSLNIPLPREKASADAEALSRDFNRRLNFMGFARDGKYTNIIRMPWEVLDSNADSVSGNTVVWRPVVNKFLFTDYVMYAECRKLNFWAIYISGAFLILTIIVWLWRSKPSVP